MTKDINSEYEYSGKWKYGTLNNPVLDSVWTMFSELSNIREV